MFNLRIKALEEIPKRTPVTIDVESLKLEKAFAEDVFGDRELQKILPSSAYKAFKKAVEKGADLDPQLADQIAAAMKEWAVNKGATHFAHWFQPLTGLTAEKHDSFIGFSGSPYNRTLSINLDGKQLIKGEPDASSFPNGGLRSTFEARGYTAWDMESPSFIRKTPNGSFLTIPTAFASWTGDALDLKTPLLRSNLALSTATIRLLNLLGDNKATSAFAQLGIEQEFFIIDRGFYLARPDLVAAGRTLLGAVPAKGQQMEDHYFGSLNQRILCFLQDVEWRLWRLGVPVTTRHNEVAPSQHEMAPIFESISIACDHNMVMMDVLKETALEHNFVCLLHEKPFAGVNGSGKHNNWSIGTNTGDNLMDPGHSPAENVRFLLFLAALVRAISVNGDLLRVSIAVPGNEHRLGMNEAPPAIISIYIGDQLLQVVNDIINDNESGSSSPAVFSWGVKSLPKFPKDASDRNRTSPFAFAGNKFEFRAVGSSQACARPAMVLNAIMSESLHYVADQVEKESKSKKHLNEITQSIVKTIFTEHQRAIFNGNGYSQEWRDEAKRRGLFNLPTLPDAVQQLTSPKNIKLFHDCKVLSEREVHSLQHVLYENYSKHQAVEADCLYSMVNSNIIPTALAYKKQLLDTLNTKESAQAEYLAQYDQMISKLISTTSLLNKVRREARNFGEDKLHEQAAFYRGPVYDAMCEVRLASDTIEEYVDDKYWPFPKYSEMLLLK